MLSRSLWSPSSKKLTLMLRFPSNLPSAWRAPRTKRLRMMSRCRLTSSSTDTLILVVVKSSTSRTDTSQLFTSSATTTTSSRSINMTYGSSNSLFWTEPIVAVGYQATTGPPFKSASHKLSSKKSRSGISQVINC